MPVRTVRLKMLIDPTSNNTGGKFYIAALDPEAFLSVYGTNSPNSSGQMVTPRSLRDMENTVSKKEKPRGNYIPAQRSDVPVPALNSLVREVLSRLKLPASSSWSINSTGNLDIDTAGGAAPPQSGGAKKPRLRKSEGVQVWI